MQQLAIEGGPKVRTSDWPERAKRFDKQELKHLKQALQQNTLFYMYGQKTKQMCRKMARLCGAKHVVPCSSGSAAIHGAIKACDVGPGDEVITSPITDAGTILGIVYEGALPVFADVDPRTYSITAKSIEERITARTRAVVVVHLAGCPADIKPIVRLCKRRDIRLIEDCAQSWCAKVSSRWVGTFGDLGCFSLNDFKHITAGDGGLIVTDNEELYRRAWLSVDKCYDRIDGKRSLPFAAPNYRISELQSAVAIAQLGKVRKITSARNTLGRRLGEKLSDVPGVLPHRVIPDAYATWWFYLIQIEPERLGADAPAFAEAVAAEGIPVSAGYVQPVYLTYEYLRRKSAFNHSQWPFTQARKSLRYEKGYCPDAERVMQNVVFFPLREELSAREIDDTAAAVRKVAGCYAERRGARTA